MSAGTSALISSPRSAGLFALLSLATTLAGCAARSLPASFPASSAASPQAEEAPVLRVGVAVAEDPPLPGESTEDWHGLGPDPGAGGHDPHQHHHGHAYGDAPAKAPESDHAR